jgi:hypothetical protein
MKMSKRDLQIAKVSLLVYPPTEAWHIANQTNVRNLKTAGISFQFAYRSRKSIQAQIDNPITGETLTIKRRLGRDSGKKIWCATFARVALEAVDEKMRFNQQIRLQKILTDKQLCRRMDWSKAVGKLLVEHPDSSVRSLTPDGLAWHRPRTNEEGLAELSTRECHSLIALAKNFVSTDKPVEIIGSHSIFWPRLFADSAIPHDRDSMGYALNSHWMDVYERCRD